MPISVRLDVQTERLIDRISQIRRQTKSEVVREAIRALAREECNGNSGGSPYELVADLLGCVRGGPSDLSVETGKKFRSLLAGRKRGR